MYRINKKTIDDGKHYKWGSNYKLNKAHAAYWLDTFELINNVWVPYTQKWKAVLAGGPSGASVAACNIKGTSQ